MPSDPTTAAELHALVSQWPGEARPKDLDYDPPRPTTPKHIPWEWWTYAKSENDGGFRARSPISQSHAIDLHVASGIRWLLTKGHVGIKDIGQVRVVVSFPAPRDPVIEYSKIGGTLIEALHAAIMATAKEGA